MLALIAQRHVMRIAMVLQAYCGLPVAPNAPLLVFLGRLTDQKGVDLLLKALYRAVGPATLAQEAFERSVKNLCEQVRHSWLACIARLLRNYDAEGM